MKKSLSLLVLCVALPAFSQSRDWIQVQDIDVIEAGKKLSMPWAGGMNLPQFSSMDLDGDGREDMVVFERDGDVVRTFIYKDGEYRYEPHHERFFPVMRNWALLVDHNGDGLKDIYAFNVLGIELWTRVGRDTLHWEKEYFDYRTPTGIVRRDAIKTIGQSGYDININVNYQDIPAISDIDGDGLPDILCFGLTTALPQGVTLEYFRQVEPLVYVREDYCWGGFVQSYTSNDIYLDVCHTRDSIVVDRPALKMMHLGSALLAMDVSGNGLKDIIMGELSFPNATVVYNTGSRTYARMTSCDAHFPSGDIPIHLENLPAFYAVDIDDDGDEELIAAPAVTGSENYNNVLLYENKSSTSDCRFVKEKSDFMVGEMIDVGECSRATFADVNRNGRKDMIVSTYGYYNKGGGYTSRLSLYENTSNTVKNTFTLVDEDYAGLSSWKKVALHPAFEDINGDGLMDMVVGDGEGYVHLLIGKKDGTYVAERYYVCGVDVGMNAIPAIWDVNGDGLKDIVVGGSDGYLRLLGNVGSLTDAKYSLLSHRWADIDYSRYASLGNTLSAAFYKQDNRQYMLLGLQDGRIALYELDAGNLKLCDEDVLGLRVGKNATAAYYVAPSGDNYIIAGCMAGGFLLFKEKDMGDDIPHDASSRISLYPNPVSDILHVDIKGDKCVKWEVYNVTGTKCEAGYTTPIDVKHLPNGVYILRLEGEGGDRYLSRFIVK